MPSKQPVGKRLPTISPPLTLSTSYCPSRKLHPGGAGAIRG
ncbi:MAG: hypothetical protein WCK05_16680 [Planctomycetota bacterium]